MHNETQKTLFERYNLDKIYNVKANVKQGKSYPRNLDNIRREIRTIK